jgi:exosortase A
MPLDLTLGEAAAGPDGVPQSWRAPLLRLALAWAGLVALTWGEWAEMADQWWNASTYNHILLVPPILAWLVRPRWRELARLTPQAWWPGFGLLVAGAAAWLAGTAAGINLVGQLGAVLMLQAAVPILLGPRAAAGLLFPLAYMAFLVPFGDEIVPALQAITAKLAVALTHASGVPATIDGVFIDTPAGLFEVAEACSGVKFLVAMIALGALVAHLCFAAWKRRALFMVAAAVVPVLANGVRAWGTIYVAQSQGVEFAAGFDHIVYGWIFFAVVMAVLLGASWRFFDRSPEDPLIDAERLEASPLLARWARRGIGGWSATAVVLLLPAVVISIDRIARLP